MSRINFHPKSNQTTISVTSVNSFGSDFTKKGVTFGERFLVIRFNENDPQMYLSNVVTEGDEVRIECQIGFTECGKDIYWFFNNMLIDEFPSRFKIKNTSTKFSRRKTLIFKNIAENDEGLYECLLARAEDRRNLSKLSLNSNFESIRENGMEIADQRASQYIKVLLKSPPKVYANFEHNSLVSMPSGTNFELICKVLGNPSPVLKWFKNGEEVKNSSKAFVDGMKLIFGGIESEDAGNYSCVAENILGKDEKFLKLQSKLKN